MGDLQVEIRPETMNLVKELLNHPGKKDMGGILLGKVQSLEKGLKVEIFGAINANPHESFIKEFHYDHSIWRQLYAAKAGKYPDLDILGWYRFSSAEALIPDANDIAIQKAYFNDKHHIFLMVNPQDSKECVFQWEKNYLVPLDEPDEGSASGKGGFAMEREEIFAAPSAFPELAKEVESLMEQSSLVTAQVSSMLEHKQTEPVVEIAESKEPIPLSLKIMGGLAGLLTLLTLLIYPAIKTADTDEPDSQVAVGQANQGITQPAGGKPKAAQIGVRKSEGESNPATQNKGLSQPAVPEKSGSDSPPEKAGVNSNDSEPDPTNQEQKQLANQSKGTRTYVVQSGDSLWKISERLYGSGFKFYLLISANGIATPSELNTGMVLMVPPDK